MIRWEYCRTYDIAGIQLHSMVVKQQQWWQRRTSTWQQCCQWTVHTDVHCAIAATLTQRRHSVYRHCCYAETDEKTTTWQRHWAVLSFQEVSSVICGIQLSIHSQFSFNSHTRQTYLNCQSKCHYFFGSQQSNVVSCLRAEQVNELLFCLSKLCIICSNVARNLSLRDILLHQELVVRLLM